MKRVVLLSVALLLVSAASLFGAAPRMQEGKWEIVTSINLEGMPFSMPPMTVNQCFTKKDVEDGSKTRPSVSQAGDCELKGLKQTATSASWKVVCKDGSTGTGQATYRGASYTATMTMAGKDTGKSTTTIKARRVGDCK